MDHLITTCEEMEQYIHEVGFIPLFSNKIPGFSIEEHTDPSVWFSKDVDGPWEWKGPIIRNRNVIYGKLFQNKTGFISLDWAKHFVNYRRDGYDFDSRCDEGLARYEDQYIYNTILEKNELRSKTLKKLCNYGKDGNKGFDTILNRLQMQTYLIVSNFVYEFDKHGDQYGWGVAVYSTPEHIFGKEWVEDSYRYKPEESRMWIEEHIRNMYPWVDEKIIRKMVG